MSHSKQAAHSGHLGHIISTQMTLTVLITLLILTAITVAVAQFDFGAMNIVVALVIATLKASLVILFFMHGAYENRVLWTYILIPFILVGIMIGGIFTDNPFRVPTDPMKIEGAAKK